MGNAKLLMELETKISQVIDTTLFNDDVYALLICTLPSIDKKKKKTLTHTISENTVSSPTVLHTQQIWNKR